jgi:hypothetical protein
VNPLLPLLCIGLFSSYRLAPAENSSSGRASIPAESRAQASFDSVKGLAGTWNGVVTTDPRNPELDGPIEVTMRVAAGGHLLMHEIAPGGVPEPTLIFREGDHLTLVHYCDAGNRPRLVTRSSPDSRTVAFEFGDISGSKMPAYMNQFVFNIIGPDHHTEDWTFTVAGDKKLRAHFDLKRTNEGGSPAAH